jgi:hypothetical protein
MLSTIFRIQCPPCTIIIHTGGTDVEFHTGMWLLNKEFLLLFLSIIGFVVFVMPVLALIHELGHAVVALLLTDGDVFIFLGSNKHWQVAIGRLVIFGSLLTGQTGLCSYEPDTEAFSWMQQIGFYLAGPIASLFAFLCALIANVIVVEPWLRFLLPIIVWYQFISLVLTFLPITYPSWFSGRREKIRSDGYQALTTFSHARKR